MTARVMSRSDTRDISEQQIASTDVPSRMDQETWVSVMADSWEAHAGLCISSERGASGHATKVCSACNFRAEPGRFFKHHAPVLCSMLAASRAHGVNADAKTVFKSTGLKGDGSWRQSLPEQVQQCATPLTVSLATNAATVRTSNPKKRPLLASIAEEGVAVPDASENVEPAEKRPLIWNPLSAYHPVPKPWARNGTGYEASDLCSFVLEAENLIRETGRWCPLFKPIVDALDLWTRGGPFPSAAIRSNFKTNLSVLKTRLQAEKLG